jgi:hypothetical protein
MASPSQTNPAYSVPSFNAWDRLLRIHQEVMDFLHYQSHIRFAATTSILPGTRPAVEQEGKQSSSSSARNDDRSGSSRASSTWSTPTTTNSSSGMKTHWSHETKTGEPSYGDPSHNGKTHRRHHRLKSNHHSKTGSSAPHNNHPHHYNPRADETNYDDYETPEIGDIHRDEVYNNID